MHKFLINDFEGPLDLLLHLLKQFKMDIYEINIVEITHQYLEYIKSMENMNLDIASEYLVMAAELIEMKSRHLLPSNKSHDEDTYEENPEQELQRRLLEYQKYKLSIDKFKELESTRHEVFTKNPERVNSLTESKIKNLDSNIFDLLKAFENVLERVEYNKPKTTKIAKKELQVKDRICDIREKMSKSKKIKFEDLFEQVDKELVVVTFLSLLIMAKDNEIKIIQKNNFDKIYLERVD